MERTKFVHYFCVTVSIVAFAAAGLAAIYQFDKNGSSVQAGTARTCAMVGDKCGLVGDDGCSCSKVQLQCNWNTSLKPMVLQWANLGGDCDIPTNEPADQQAGYVPPTPAGTGFASGYNSAGKYPINFERWLCLNERS